MAVDVALPPEVTAELWRRALALAQPAPEAVGRDEGTLLTFLRAGSRYAVPAGRVREVLAPDVVSALPRSDHHLVGFRASRGVVLPVADIATLTRGERPASPSTCFVVVLDGPEPVGLLAEAVTMQAATATVNDISGASELVVGIAGDGVVVIDVDAVLADPRLRTGGAAPSEVRGREGRGEKGAP